MKEKNLNKKESHCSIKVVSLTKSYNSNILALNNISFSINKGEIVGFLGPNGAGKTTTLNILTGCLSYDRGEVLLNGFDISKHPEKAKETLGYLPEQPPLHLNMTINEYLNYVCGLKKIKDKQTEISKVCAHCRIGANLNILIGNLSKGYKQRVGIAQALLGSPSIVVLDEPTSGLDPLQIVEIRDLIKSLAQKHTIVLSTQILSEIHSLCDKIVILCGGEIIAYGTEKDILSKTNSDIIYNIGVLSTKQKVLKALESVEDRISIQFSDDVSGPSLNFSVNVANNRSLRYKISELFMKHGICIVEFTDNTQTLEEAFLKLTTLNAQKKLDENSDLKSIHSDKKKEES